MPWCCGDAPWTSMLTTRTYGSNISITFRRTLSSRCNRSRDIPVTLAHLNNIHFNRFQNEFHYFSRFHGNSCPAGKYISLANPPRRISFLLLALAPSNAGTPFSSHLPGRWHSSMPLPFSTLLSHSLFLSSLLFSPDLLSIVSLSYSWYFVHGTSDFYRFAPFMFIRRNKASMGSLLAMKLKSCLSSGGIRAFFSFASWPIV